MERYFGKFLNEFSISGGLTDRNFEKFINYSILFPKNISNFNLASVSTGDSGDCAIDGLAIVLNNKYISTFGELEDILESGMEFSVEIYFIQAKTSDKFDGKEMLQFGTGVLDVFKDGNSLTKVRNEKIKEKCKMIQMLLSNYDFFKPSPRCYLYYVTTGTWLDDQNLLSDKEKIMSDIKNLDIFENNIEFYTYGSKEIRKHYELTKVQNSATFELKEKIELPYMEGVEESYLATLPIKEYLKLIVDDQNKIIKGIFELNVRDFNGIQNNRVNQEIINTINSNTKNYFGLMNNGITIVGKSLSKGKGLYTIKNFYVVNGCQTSNILHLNSEHLDNNMWIAIKIVITDDDTIIKNIVKATNNQTEVQEIQLLSLSEYQELLESYFNSYSGEFNLYYERRSGQYNYNGNIDKSKIINPEIQMRSFASIFLDAPHRASRFYGSLREDIEKDDGKDVGKGIFVTGQQPIIYYTSALLLHIIDNYFNDDKIDDKYSKFRYHLLYVISKIVWKNEKQPQLNSKKIEQYCNILINQIVDTQQFEDLLEQAKEVINKVIVNLDDQEANRSAQVVNSLLMYIELGVTNQTLKLMVSFLNGIDYLSAPFYNMRLDGDLRYNFIDRLNDLIRRFSYYKLNSKVNELEIIKSAVDVESRASRRTSAKEIYDKVEDLCKQFKKSLELSKKYQKQQT